MLGSTRIRITKHAVVRWKERIGRRTNDAAAVEVSVREANYITKEEGRAFVDWARRKLPRFALTRAEVYLVNRSDQAIFLLRPERIGRFAVVTVFSYEPVRRLLPPRPPRKMCPSCGKWRRTAKEFCHCNPEYKTKLVTVSKVKKGAA